MYILPTNYWQGSHGLNNACFDVVILNMHVDVSVVLLFVYVLCVMCAVFIYYFYLPLITLAPGVLVLAK